MMSAIGTALGGTLGMGDNLAQQVGDETEETRRKRILAAKQAGYSPVGQALTVNNGSILGALAQS